MDTKRRPWRANRDLPCREPGCDQPRQVSGEQVRTRCRAHETARLAALKSRAVLDPKTGETITAGLLASRTWLRKQQAAKAAGTGR